MDSLTENAGRVLKLFDRVWGGTGQISPFSGKNDFLGVEQFSDLARNKSTARS